MVNVAEGGTFVDSVAERGGVVEERIMRKAFPSPSSQRRNTPLGDVELLSTHDQMLDGSAGQSYLGCIFPADVSYAPLITREAARSKAPGQGRRARPLRAGFRRRPQRRPRLARLGHRDQPEERPQHPPVS